jgi:signal transduction histidine kinase
MDDGQSTGKSEKIRKLHHAATDIMAASDAKEVYRTTVATAKSVLDFDFCYISVYNGSTFEVAASTDMEPGSTLPYDENEGVIGESYTEQKSIVTRCISHDENAQPLREEFSSGLSVPVGDDAVLQAVSTTEGYYTERELELAELLVVHTEAALDQVRSEKLLKEQNRKIERLHAVATDLESCRSHDEIFDLLIDASKDVLGFEWCTLSLVENREFVIAAASGQSPVDVGEVAFSVDEGVAGHVHRTGESDLTTDIRALGDAVPVSSDIRSGIQVPVGDIGVYSVMHNEPDMFDEADLELAELLAASVAEAYERIEIEKRLQRQNQALERQNERLDKFASIITHDLRNPLNVAELRTDLLSQEVDSEHIESLRDAHNRMETMLDDLLAIVRADAIVEETEPVDIETMAVGAWRSVDTGDATLHIDSPEDWTVDGAPDLLRHVFENLFRNAVEHGSTSNRTQSDDSVEHGSTDARPQSDTASKTDVRVRVGILDGADRAPSGFYVEDDGPGIPEDEREKVFEHGFTISDDGHGFGLAIVADLVEAHGWQLTLTDSSDGGARFEIRTD